MKKVLKACGILFSIFVVLGAILFGVVMYFTSGLTQSAETFFDTIKNGDVQQAYDSTAGGLKISVPFDAFAQGIERIGLKNYSTSSWQYRKISGGRGTLNGTLTYNDGTVLPADLDFIKEQGTWKIFELHVGNSD